VSIDASPGSSAPAPPAPDPIPDAWAEVERAWDDPEAHRRFRALCATLGRLPEAGRRYREVRDRDPARREAAERHIDALLALAASSLEGLRSPPRDLAGRRRGLFLVALIVGVGMVIVAMLASS